MIVQIGKQTEIDGQIRETERQPEKNRSDESSSLMADGLEVSVREFEFPFSGEKRTPGAVGYEIIVTNGVYDFNCSCDINEGRKGRRNCRINYQMNYQNKSKRERNK